MKLILDVSSVVSPLTGIGRYTLELGRALQGERAIDELKYLYHGELQDDFSFEYAHLADPVKVPAYRGWLRRLLPHSVVLEPYRKRRAEKVAATLDAQAPCVFHSPNFDLPPIRGKSIVTLHDLSVFTFPQFHPRDRRVFLQNRIRESVSRAHLLVTDSEYIRREVIDLFGLNPDRVRCVPLGVDERYQPLEVTRVQPVLSALGLDYGGYTLCVGTLEPRKNLHRLLDAWQALEPSLRRAYPLVLAGGYGWASQDLLQRIEGLCATGDLVYLDYVAEQDLPALYAGAIAFYYPSLYEGFGLPVLEAMKSGVPVVCSSASSLPELVGDCALQFDAEDVSAITGALHRSLTDSPWRERARREGLARAGAYTWQRTTAAMLDIYRETAP